MIRKKGRVFNYFPMFHLAPLSNLLFIGKDVGVNLVHFGHGAMLTTAIILLLKLTLKFENQK